MNTIKLPNGSTAIDFTPKDSKDKAIVHLSTIKKLTKLLPLTRWSDIREDIIMRLYEANDLKAGVEVMSDEVAFHESVNLISAYQPLMTVTDKAALIGQDITDGIKEANEMIDADLNKS